MQNLQLATLYKKNGCIECQKIFDYLKDKGIEATVLDVENRENALAMVMLRRKAKISGGFPVLVIGKKIYVGSFDKEKLDIFLGDMNEKRKETN